MFLAAACAAVWVQPEAKDARDGGLIRNQFQPAHHAAQRRPGLGAAAGQAKDDFLGTNWEDEWVYKWLEAACYTSTIKR